MAQVDPLERLVDAPDLGRLGVTEARLQPLLHRARAERLVPVPIVFAGGDHRHDAQGLRARRSRSSEPQALAQEHEHLLGRRVLQLVVALGDDVVEGDHEAIVPTAGYPRRR